MDETAPAPMDVAPLQPRSRLGNLLFSQCCPSSKDLERTIDARDQTGSVLKPVLVNRITRQVIVMPTSGIRYPSTRGRGSYKGF